VKWGIVARLGWMLPGSDLVAEAVNAARDSDVAVVVAGLGARFEGESFDRKSLELPGIQNELITAVCDANPNTIVVLVNDTPITMDPWIQKAPAVVEAFHPGQEGGHALADILFGDSNPSGRLPMTFPQSWKDSSAFGHYPGDSKTIGFGEGVFVGYRHFDREVIEPLFPFGHGMSYTTFKYSGLKIHSQEMGPDDHLQVSLKIKNTGPREGA
jgi:beta-glucosidase